jgi:hypothetical protein
MDSSSGFVTEYERPTFRPGAHDVIFGDFAVSSSRHAVQLAVEQIGANRTSTRE